MKPNNTLHYVNLESNHPPVMLKHIPEGVNKRLSEISSDEEEFSKAPPQYQKVLDDAGYSFKLHSFKTRLANNKASFKETEKRNVTELKKDIWKLKENYKDCIINWKILCKAQSYSNVTDSA